jgi:hypothetical protein
MVLVPPGVLWVPFVQLHAGGYLVALSALELELLLEGAHAALEVAELQLQVVGELREEFVELAGGVVRLRFGLVRLSW